MLLPLALCFLSAGITPSRFSTNSHSHFFYFVPLTFEKNHAKDEGHTILPVDDRIRTVIKEVIGDGLRTGPGAPAEV